MSETPSTRPEDRLAALYRSLTNHELERILPGSEAACFLGDRYEARGRLGEGATAIVYRGWDRKLDRAVAIKVLRDRAKASPIARERFRREAHTAATLAHPNVVQVYDAGEAGESVYIVMELVEGRPLSKVLSESALSLEQRVRLLEGAARGVAAGAAKGIVHRDLKPANILVTEGGVPKVGDFGLAHLVDTTAGLTKTGATLGTPLYMAPEQVEGRPDAITPATDVYALGAILYEILAGRTPQTGETLAEVYGNIMRHDPVAPRKINPQAPRDLETVALKALEKDPRKRYSTAQEFGEDLRRALEGEPIQARPLSGLEKLWRKAVRYRAILLPTAAAIILGAVIAVIGVLSGRKAASGQELLVLERLEGTVTALEGERRLQVHQGQFLVPGQGLETGPRPSSCVLRFANGTQIELGAETTLSRIQIEGGKRVVLRKGVLRGQVTEPLAVETPYGEAVGSGSRLNFIVDPDPTKGAHVEVEEGKVEIRSSDGKRSSLQSGQFAVLGGAHDLTPRALTLKLDLGEGIGLEMIYVRPGTFTMGGTDEPKAGWEVDSRPAHRVTLTRGYYLGKYEVTRGQFAAFVRATGHKTDAERKGKALGTAKDGQWKEIEGAHWRTPAGFTQTDEHPVVYVSWNDTKAFCDWATKKAGRTVGLPTEAEWEYACRAGTQTLWSFGDDETAFGEYGWCNWNSLRSTAPVGRKKPNAWGLYDMHGNVWEFCQDFAAPYAGDAVDPKGPAGGVRRIARGGDWGTHANFARSAFRHHGEPRIPSSDHGFRVAVSLNPP